MNSTAAPGRLLSGAYDPDTPSDGLTLDTPLGPVDLVVIDRARRGYPTAATPAERAYLWALILAGDTTRTTVAAALRLSGATVGQHIREYARRQAASLGQVSA